MKAKWVSRDKDDLSDVWLWAYAPHADQKGIYPDKVNAMTYLFVEALSALGFRVPAEGTCIRLERVEE